MKCSKSFGFFSQKLPDEIATLAKCLATNTSPNYPLFLHAGLYAVPQKMVLTFFSLKHFGHLSRSCVKTRHNSVFACISNCFWSFQNCFGL